MKVTVNEDRELALLNELADVKRYRDKLIEEKSRALCVASSESPTGGNMSTAIDAIAKAKVLAQKLDGKITGFQGYESVCLTEWLGRLLKDGRVEVGWRESCSYTEPTVKVAREWWRVVAALRKGGVKIGEERVKHRNPHPGKNGFWQSVIYSTAAFSPTPPETT